MISFLAFPPVVLMICRFINCLIDVFPDSFLFLLSHFRTGSVYCFLMNLFLPTPVLGTILRSYSWWPIPACNLFLAYKTVTVITFGRDAVSFVVSSSE